MRISYLLITFSLLFLSFECYSSINTFNSQNVSFLVSSKEDPFFHSHKFDLGCTSSPYFSEYTSIDDSSISVLYAPNDNGSARLRYSCNTSYRHLSALITFKVKFSSNFDWAKGGKMHGVGSLHPRTGGRESNSRDWSLRLSFLKSGQVAFYIYDAVTEGWGRMIKSEDFKFTTGQWYDLAIIVSLDKNTNLGVAKLHIDNDLIILVERVELSLEDDGASIQTAIFQTFHGGNNSSFSPTSESQALFKDFLYFFF